MKRNVATVAVLLLGLCPMATIAQPDRPLPLDPLTPREVELAQRVSRADGRIREMVGQRKSVIGATYFLALKPDTLDVRVERPRDPVPIRAALVLIYVYDGDYGVSGLVDLSRSTVLKVERLENEPVPFAAEEINTAQQLALRDPRVRQAIGPAAAESRIEWLGVTAVDERDPCYKHRCVQLLFRRGRAFLMRPIVIVDLTTQTVRLEEPPR
jgi:Cu2+-containing amine oxidase